MRRVAVHEDGTHGGGPAQPGRVTVRLAGDGVAVSTDDRAPALRSVIEHREDVVRRLLRRGLSPRVLHALVPGFAAVIDRVERS
jgi:hypothetical protein